MNSAFQNAKSVLVTGGAGFIGSALVRHLITQSEYSVHVLDKLTYAATLTSLESVSLDPRYGFTRADICEAQAVQSVFERTNPDIVIHLAAESHVDRSIDGPQAFIQTNIVGTYTLLQAARAHWEHLAPDRKANFRFHHVSTDEVFGTLGDDGYFNENTAYDPKSPYSASKAGSDHLVRAWHHTYGLPITLTNCSNNYGPYHFPEKLIPLVILKALAGKPLPVYGRGENVRDWLFVDDHVRAIQCVFERAEPGSTYTIGGNSERKNIEVVTSICEILDTIRPRPQGGSYAELISFVTDRPGHDFRYAIDASAIQRDLGWQPIESFESGLAKTVQWYLDNEPWWKSIQDGSSTGERLGLKRL